MDIAIKTVMNLYDFVSSPDINAAFSGLVAAVVQATTLPKWCNDEVCREVQRRCSLSESEMEMYWSQRITSSARPQQELEKFWYIDNIIGFKHLSSRQYMEFSVEPPEEFNNVLMRLRKENLINDLVL